MTGGGLGGGGVTGGGAGGGAGGGGGPVAGDTCASPIAVTMAGVQTGSTVGATADYRGGGAQNCDTASGRDVVYAITVPANSRLDATATPGPNFDLVLNLVNAANVCGGAMGGMTCLDASDGPQESSAEHVSLVNSTSMARQVLLVVDGFGRDDVGSFTLNVALQTIAAGDRCENPEALPANMTTPNQTLSSFNNDYGAGNGPNTQCAFQDQADRVYSLAVPAGNRLTVNVAGSGFDPSISLVGTAAGCATRTCLGGVDRNGVDGGETLTWDNASAASRDVLVLIDSSNASPTASFAITATLALSPPTVDGGATCATPQQLDAGTYLSSTAGRSSQFSLPGTGGCESTGNGPDSVFGVTLPANSVTLVTLEPNQWNAVLNAFASPAACLPSADAGITCLASSDGTGFTSTERVTLRNATASPLSSILVVDGSQSNSSGAFNLTIDTVPAPNNMGDTCQAPQVIASSGTLSGLTTVGYFNDVTTSGQNCDVSPSYGPERVFSISVAPSQTLTAVVVPTGWNPSVYLLDASGACGSNVSCLVGQNAAGAGMAETVQFTNNGANARTVLIVVDQDAALGTGGPFSLITSLTP